MNLDEKIELDLSYAQDEPVAIFARGHWSAQVFLSLIQTEPNIGEEALGDLPALGDVVALKVRQEWWVDQPDPTGECSVLYVPCSRWRLGSYPVTVLDL